MNYSAWVACVISIISVKSRGAGGLQQLKLFHHKGKSLVSVITMFLAYVWTLEKLSFNLAGYHCCWDKSTFPSFHWYSHFAIKLFFPFPALLGIFSCFGLFGFEGWIAGKVAADIWRNQIGKWIRLLKPCTMFRWRLIFTNNASTSKSELLDSATNRWILIFHQSPCLCTFAYFRFKFTTLEVAK